MTGAIINELQSRFVLFSCEGTAEAVVIEKLFESGMLIIHAEGMYDDWLRKSRMDRQLRPSDYCKRNLGLASVKERNFLAGYWANADKLIAGIRSYAGKRGKRKSGELMLVDLIS